jgi:hypothetical protein
MKHKMHLILISISVSMIQGCVFPKGISSYFSKDMCSCLFVVGRTEKRCEVSATTLFDVNDYDVDYKKKLVTSNFLFVSTQAKFISERYGCQIQ